MKSIAAFEIPQHWEKIANLLQPVLQRDEVEFSLEDVRQFLLKGDMQAWHHDWETIFVTQISCYGTNPAQPTTRVCYIIYCAGKNIGEWLHKGHEHFTAWAKSLGCHRLRIIGRKGWEKKLVGLGYSSTGSIVEYKLWDGGQS